jgi:hypothetical protein
MSGCGPRGGQRWSTFLRNHAEAVIACDFFVAVTATFRMLYVFVVIEHETRRLRHVNVTANPTADGTLQQLREAVGEEREHRYLIHDRDRIFSRRRADSRIRRTTNLGEPGVEIFALVKKAGRQRPLRLSELSLWGSRNVDVPFCVHAKHATGDTAAANATINSLKDHGYPAI